MQRAPDMSADLVPLAERIRMLALFRVVMAGVIVIAWLGVPSTRGLPLVPTVGAVAGYVGLMQLLSWGWLASGRRGRALFGVVAMADGLWLAALSYGIAGLDSPLRLLLLVQLIAVSLLASFRSGLKLALFHTWVLLSAVYIQEAGAFDTLGGNAIGFGEEAYRRLGVDVAVFVLIAGATSIFGAVNERELRRRRYDLEALAAFTLDLEQRRTPAEIGAALLAGVADIYGCEPGIVLRRDGSELRVIAARNLPMGVPSSPGGLRVPILTAALDSGETQLIAAQPTDDDDAIAAFGPPARLVAVPLHGARAGFEGLLVVANPVRNATRIERRALAMVERFASHAALAAENALLLSEVRAMASTDGLTKIPNRRTFDESIARACDRVARGQGTLGLLLLDIDRFKQLNDTHGHQCGDETLQIVARTLEGTVGAGDIAARYGGEEFAILSPDASRESAYELAEAVRAACEAMQGPVPITVSIGVSLASSGPAEPAELIASADRALYAAKEGGRNRVVQAGPAPLAEARAS